MQFIRHFVVLIVLVLAPAATADEEPWQADRVWVAGSDDQTWVVGASKNAGEHLPEVRMWHLGPKTRPAKDLPAPSRFLLPISADPVRVGADAEGLRVLLSNMLTWNFFGDRHSAAGDLWSDLCREPPLAWGGDASKPIFWALVKSKALNRQFGTSSTQPSGLRVGDSFVQPMVPSTAPAEKQNHEVSINQSDSDSQPPTQGLTLLRLQNGFWRPGPVLKQAEGGDAFWLAGRNGVIDLFWRTPLGEIQFARYDNEQWSSPEIVTQWSDGVRGWAGDSQAGPVFVVGGGKAAGAITLTLFIRHSEKWSNDGEVRDGNDYLSVDSLKCDVAVARNKLAIIRRLDTGEIEFGSSNLSNSPLVHFSRLSTRTADKRSESDWNDAIKTGLVLGLLTVVLFTRRDQVSRLAVVPNGWVVTPVYRRVMATCIDLLPAMLVVLPWWMSLYPNHDFRVLDELRDDPEFIQKILPINITVLLIFGLWCLIWELTSGTTLGKRLFGCRVLSSNGLDPSTRQIIIRNVMRVITIGIGPPAWMVAMMLMLLFTRNRQRIGDLMAGTIVVQPGDPNTPPLAQPRDKDDSGDSHE